MLINMTLIAGLVTMPNKLFTSIVLILILFGQIYELLFYVNKTNRSLSNFLDALKDKSYSSGNIELVDKSFQSLNQSFKTIAKSIFDSQIEKEAQSHLLKLIIDKVQTGILLTDQNNGVILMNQSVLNNLNLKYKNSFDYITKEIPALKDAPFVKKEIKKIIEVTINHNKQQFLTYITPIKLIDKSYVLITFNNIQEELDKNEVQSWQKLLRTLSHEIMNSVTPISSLAETSINHIQKENKELKGIDEIDVNVLEKIQKALTTIERRSSGLYDFVNDFRKLAKIPDPVKKEFFIQDLFDTVVELIFQNKKQENLNLNVKVMPKELSLNADFKLMEQVLINLLINAKDATSQKKQIQIELRAFKEKNNTLIQVVDNGVGISTTKIDQIFIPFFTTKETLPDGLSAEKAGTTGGSGIGLSLSRQIMLLHGGNISVQSEPDKETVFTLRF